MSKYTLAIDLDGVLNNYTKFEEGKIPEIREGAKEFIKNLYALNQYELVLYTTRNAVDAEKWLKNNDLEEYFSFVNTQKMVSYLYLDDRAISFNGDYEKAFNDIMNFKAYWQNI